MGRNDLTSRVQITLTLDKKVIEYIRNHSKETNIPMARYVEKLIREGIYDGTLLKQEGDFIGRNDLSTRVQITLTLDKDVLEYIRNYRKKTNISMARYVEKLIKEDIYDDILLKKEGNFMGRNDLTSRAQITLTLDKDVLEYIRNLSKETNIPIARYVEKLIREDMNRNTEKVNN